LGACLYDSRVPKRVWVIGTVCSALPDLDSIGFSLGIHYGDFWGHRGFTHSIFFAAALAALIVSRFFPKGVPGLSRWKLWAFLFLATASHGLLDAMTNGGLGVAFISPFDNTRYFLPRRPVQVAPISVTRFFTTRGIAVMQTELLWIWVSAALLAVTAWLLRRRHFQVEA
jgi:inner membrane protein